ncbi:MAG: gliding motility-associated-like protein [Saprospiraceae bacterium]|jgi:gliding motility-associated-like protein
MRLFRKVFLLTSAMLFALAVGAQEDNLYWVGGTGDWNDSNNWSSTSGGIGGEVTPNIQFNAIFDANSFDARAQVVTISGPVFCNSMNWTGVTNTPILDGDPTSIVNVHGSLTFVAGMRHFFEGNYEFNHGGGTNIITVAGNFFSGDIIFEGQGEWIFADALIVFGTIEFREGVFRTGNNSINAFSIYSDFQNIRVFDFEMSDIMLMQQAPGIPSSAIFGGSNLTWLNSQPSFIFSGESSFLQLEGDANFQFAEVRFKSDNSLLSSMTDLPPIIESLSFKFNGEIIGNHIINEWTLSMGHTVFLSNGSRQSVDIINTGDICDGLASLILKDDAGTNATLFFDFSPFSLDGLFLRGVHADNSDSRTITLFNSQDGGNTGDVWVIQNLNSNNKFWIGGTGDWNDRAHWSDSPGGPGGACLPKPNDNVFFDDNSFVGQPNAQVSGITPVFLNNFSFSASNFNGRIELPSLYLNGNLFLTTFVYWNIPNVYLNGNDQAGSSGNTDVQFISTGPVALINLTSQSQRRVIIESDMILSGTLSIGGIGNIAQFIASGHVITAERVISINSEARLVFDNAMFIIFGERDVDEMPLIILDPTGGITANSNGDEPIWQLTGLITGLETDVVIGPIEFNDPTGVGIIISSSGTAGSSSVTFQGDGVISGDTWNIEDLILRPGHTYQIDPNTDVFIGSMDALGTVCSPISIQSTEPGRRAEIEFTDTNNLQLEYLLLRDLSPTPLATGIYAGDGSADNGNTTGWIFPTETNQRFLGDNDIIACADSSVVLEPFLASEIDRIDWNDGESAATAYIALGPTNQEVVAHVFFLDGCDLFDTINVMFDPTFTVDLGMDTTICEGESLRLEVTIPSDTYTWSTQETGPVINVSQSGTYTVDASRGACRASDDIIVERIEVEDFTLGQDTTLCENTAYILQAPNLTSGGYIWNDSSSSNTLIVQIPGIYWVEVGQDRCTLRDSVEISYDPIITINLGQDTTICEGETLSLDASNAMASFQWSTGDSVGIISISESGTFTVDAISGACQASDEITVNRIEIEDFTLGQDTTLCENTIYTLQAPNLSSGGFVWSDGSSASTLMLRDSGIYWVEVGQDRCLLRDSVTVSFDDNINLDLGGDTTICAGTSFQLDAGAGMDSYTWSTGVTDQFQPITITDNYEVEVTRGACREQTFVFVGVSDIAEFDIGQDTTLCGGDSLSLTLPMVAGGEMYQWFDGTGDMAKDITSNGDYWLEAQEGQCTRRDSINVTFDAPITLDIGSDTVLCAGESILIDAGPDMDSYSWNTGSMAMSINATTEDTYEVTVTRGACTQVDQRLVSIVSIQPFSIGNDTTLCEGDDLILTYPATALPQSLWSDGSRMDSLIVNSTGTYWLEVGAANCAQRDSINISYDPLLSINLGSDTTLCAGDTLRIDIDTPVDGYRWSTGETSPSISISATSLIWIQTLSGTCTQFDTLNAQFISLDGLNIGSDTTLCEGEILSVNANLSVVSQYEWTDVLTGAVVSNDPIFDVMQSGSYNVVVSAERCETSDDIMVGFDPAINFSGLGPDTALCQGASIDYNFAIANAEYIWQDGSVNGEYSISGQGGTYSLQVIRNTCIANDTIEVQINDLPTVDLPIDLAFCEGEMRTLELSSNATSFLWSDGSTDSILIISQAGSYNIVVSDGACENSDSVLVSVNALPIIELGSDTSTCEGNSITIGVTAQNLIPIWNTGEVTSEITVMDAGNYILTATDSNGCAAVDSIELLVNEAPIFALNERTGLCEGDAATIQVEVPFDDIIWSTGETTSIIQVSSEQILWAEASIGTCSFRDSTDVIVQELPIVNLGLDTTICEGLSLTVDAMYPNATYTWSSGETSASISLSAAGDYNVIVDVGGCTANDDLVLSLSPTPSIDLGSDLILCEGESTSLSSGAAQGTITWSTGEAGMQITVADGATYTATADLNGCTANDEVLVSIEATPVFSLGDDIAICDQLSTSLTVDINNADVLWSTGDNSRSITVTQEGTYSATAVTPNGCVFTDEIDISKRECQRFSVYRPNVFAPLGGEDNNRFIVEPSVPENVTEYEISIFDRWGNVLYESTDFTVGWDGRAPGYKAQPGVYTYSIKVRYFDDFEDDRTEFMNGSVTLLR